MEAGQRVLCAPGRQGRVSGYLARLAGEPPQSLMLEGGTADERETLALHWAGLLNCTTGEGRPCGACESCRQIAAGVHRDVIHLSGAAEAIKIDMVRELRSLMGEPPRGGGKRVIILSEAQGLLTEAANSLLKSMEEPRPGNVFVLTAPQRERLLPTLVSRSFVLTLAWPELKDGEEPGAEPEALAAAMREFWRTGRGWLARTMERGGVDKPLAERTLVALERELAATYVRSAERPATGVVPDADLLRRLGLALTEAKGALDYRVSPALVLDWLAATVYGWLRAPGA